MAIAWSAELVRKTLPVTFSVYEELFPWLCDFLNSYNKNTWEKKQYEILLGNWFFHFVQVVYARYLEISERRDFSEYDNVDLSKLTIPDDMEHFLSLVIHSDEYNSQLKAQIGCLARSREINSDLFGEVEKQVTYRKSAGKQGSVLLYVNRLLSLFSWRKNKVVITSPYWKLTRAHRFASMFRLGNVAVFDDFVRNYETRYELDLETRANSLTREHNSLNDDVARIIKVMTVANIPSVFMEGFSGMLKVIGSVRLPEKRVYFTANALHANMLYKFYLASRRNEVTVVSHQHGGGYGIDEVNVVEEYEKSVADLFLGWGWRGTVDGLNMDLPAPMPDIPVDKKPSGMLLIMISYPRHIHRIMFQPMGDCNRVIIEQTKRFLHAVVATEEIMLRPAPDDYGWNVLNRIKEESINVKVDDLSRSSLEIMGKHKIVIANYLGTSFLESLSLNIPTVCFYDENIYSFRAQAAPYMQALSEAKIIFTDPEEAAAHISEVHESPEAWWNDDVVQKARARFVDKYANFSQDWLAAWKDRFSRLAA